MAARLDPDEALRLVLARACAVAAADVPIEDALGAELAEDVAADRDYPPFDRAMMDGFAVRLADAGRAVPVVATLDAGVPPGAPLTDGAAVEIMTGASCPEGTEAVVAVERTSRVGALVQLPAPLRPGSNVARRGAECARGAVVLRAGARVTPLVIAVLATFGVARVRVRRAPTLALVTTGDELATGEAALDPARIRDSNGPMLRALARDAGIAAPRSLHARDDDEALDAALAATADADVVVLTGGVSAGRRDLVPGALARLGAEAIFHGVTQKPGKPMLFATHRRDGRTRLLFALPGNPLAVHLCFDRYVAAALRAAAGLSTAPRKVRCALSHGVDHDDARTEWILARLDGEGEAARVTLLSGAGSADLFAPAEANAYVRFAPGHTKLEAGAMVECELTGRAKWPS